MSNNCLPFLKWTHLTICSLCAVLCVVLVCMASLDDQQSSETRLTIQVVGGVGILASLCGVLGAFKQHLCTFLVYYLFILFNAGFGIRTALLDERYWFYPGVCALLFIIATIFVIYLWRFRNRRTGREDIIEKGVSELDQNSNPKEKLMANYTGPKSDVPMKYIDED